MPPARISRLAIALAVALNVFSALTILACEGEIALEIRADGADEAPGTTPGDVDPSAPQIFVDERLVLTGVVRERIDSTPYIYLRVAVLEDTGTREERGGGRLERWVAVPRDAGTSAAASRGARLRMRSLGHRRRVWDRELELDFEDLEYVALLPGAPAWPGAVDGTGTGPSAPRP